MSHLLETIPAICIDVWTRNPERVFMQIKQGDGYRQYTCRQVAQHVSRLANALGRQGLCHGDRVAIVAENRPEWVIVYLAIVAAGGTAVPLDIQLSEKELSALLADSNSRIVVVSARTAPVVKLVVENLPLHPTVVNLDSPAEPGHLVLDELMAQRVEPGIEPTTVAPEDVASLLYTSGTTGKPKGVLLTHRNLVSNAQAVNQSGLGGAEDNFLVVLPLHHTYPFTVAFLVPLCLGARITFLQSLKAPDLLQCLLEAQVTVLVGVPQLFAMVRRAIFNEIDRRPAMVRMVVRLLLSVCGLVRQHTGLNMGKGLFAQVHRRFGASLRLLCSGGARLDPAVARDLFRLGFTLLEGYGLTETAPVVTFNPLAQPKFGSVGLPIPGVEVRIVHPGAEGIGEVVVRGPNVMKGYDGNPDATAQAIREGWFYTGDLGYLDREGYLVLTGRIKELIVTPGGKNIYPEEVEARYLASPAIAELCLVGTERTEEGGEGLHAVVVPNFAYLQAQQISDVRGHLKQELTRIGLSLPSYKRVTGLSVVKESLPRTRLGKIQRYRVAAQLAIEEPPPGERPQLSAADREALETEVGRRVVAALRPLASKRTSIVPDDHLDLDLGLDSLRRVELAVALEQWVGPLPETFAAEVITVREVIEKLMPIVHGMGEGGKSGARSWTEILQLEPPAAVMERLRSSPPWHHRVVVAGARMVLRALLHTVFRLHVRGLEHLPREGPYLLAANHASHADPFVVFAALPSAVFASCWTLGWQPYFRGPATSWIARVSHIIPVGGDAPIILTLQASAAVLRQGRVFLIFPEGRRSVNGQLQPFQRGIGILACERGVPVVPVWIEGTFEALPVDAWWPRVHRISVSFGQPLTVTRELCDRWRRSGQDPYEAATRLIRDAICPLRSSSSGRTAKAGGA